MLLAIETSCDETAAALFEADGIGKPLAEEISSQTSLHMAYGGVVPELAAREHITNLPFVIQAVLSDRWKISDISRIAVTSGPGLKGCLLVGINFAQALSMRLGCPLALVNHLEGHLFSGHLESQMDFPYMALLVSGGHTMLVEVSGPRRYQVCARTRDDAAGEAFDKIATLLQLPYPGGPQLAKLAEEGNASAYSFPEGVQNDPTSFSFSGLKTAVSRQISQLPSFDRTIAADIAASAQQAIVKALVHKSVGALQAQQTRSTQLLLCGGVAANKLLRTSLEQELANIGVKLVVPAARYCTDNAAMIGVAAVQCGRFADTPVTISARPRWPIEELVS